MTLIGYAGLTPEERADRMVQILWLMADSAGVSIRNRIAAMTGRQVLLGLDSS